MRKIRGEVENELNGWILDSRIRSAIGTSQWSISVSVLRLSIIRHVLGRRSSTRGNTCLPRFHHPFSFFFPLSRIRRPRGIDRYIFELAPVCVFNRHTRLLNFIGVVHSRARSPSIPRFGPRIYRRRVLSIFYAHIYTKIFELSQLEML